MNLAIKIALTLTVGIVVATLFVMTLGHAASLGEDVELSAYGGFLVVVGIVSFICVVCTVTGTGFVVWHLFARLAR